MVGAGAAHFERVEVRRRGRILELALATPAPRNAVDAQLHEELAHVFRWADDDRESDVVILTGAGGDFCAGGDVAWMAAIARGEAEGPTARDARRMIWDLIDMDKPTIAKVRGAAVGLGCTLALFCDVVFATEDSTIADPHVRVGLAPGDGGAVIWPALVGYGRAKQFLMSGDGLSGREAAMLGLIAEATTHSHLDAVVDDYAQRLLRLSQQGVRAAKRSVNLGLKQLAVTIFEASTVHEAASFAEPGHKAAVAAFLARSRG